MIEIVIVVFLVGAGLTIVVGAYAALTGDPEARAAATEAFAEDAGEAVGAGIGHLLDHDHDHDHDDDGGDDD